MMKLLISDQLKVCINCDKEKLYNEFRRNNKTTDGFTRLCKLCINTMSKSQRKVHDKNSKGQWYKNNADHCKQLSKINAEKTPQSFISNLYGNVTKGRHSDNVNITCEDLIDLYKLQNGLCAFTCLPMSTRRGAADAISVDRKDSNRGYIKGNIHLVCQFVNLGKRTRSDVEVDSFIDKIRNNGALAGTKCYLAGPIEFETPNGSIQWRTELSNVLRTIGIKVFDPLNKPKWVPEAFKIDPKMYLDILPDTSNSLHAEYFHSAQFMVESCTRMAQACDFMIVNLPRVFTAGTFYEIKIATDSHKPILFINKDKYPATWLMSLFHPNEYDGIFFESLGDLKNHLLDINADKIELDPLKWNFISYFRDGYFKSQKWMVK